MSIPQTPAQPVRIKAAFSLDTGYGVCTPCGNATAHKEGEAAATSYYGTRGIHWDL